MKRSLSFFEIAWAWSNKKGKDVFGDCLFQFMTIFIRISLTSCDQCSHTAAHCFLESVLVKQFSRCLKISVRSPGKFGITWNGTTKQELASPEGRLRWAAGMPPPDAPGGPGQQQQPFEEYVPGIGRYQGVGAMMMRRKMMTMMVIMIKIKIKIMMMIKIKIKHCLILWSPHCTGRQFNRNHELVMWCYVQIAQWLYGGNGDTWTDHEARHSSIDSGELAAGYFWLGGNFSSKAEKKESWWQRCFCWGFNPELSSQKIKSHGKDRSFNPKNGREIGWWLKSLWLARHSSLLSQLWRPQPSQPISPCKKSQPSQLQSPEAQQLNSWKNQNTHPHPNSCPIFWHISPIKPTTAAQRWGRPPSKRPAAVGMNASNASVAVPTRHQRTRPRWRANGEGGAGPGILGRNG